MRPVNLILVTMLANLLNAQDLAIVGAKVYTSPEAPAANNTTIVIKAGKIVALGQELQVPDGTNKLVCSGCVVFPGFWNTHVHFMESKWLDAAHKPAAELTRQLQQMLTHNGFTTVVDTGSYPENTIALRARVESGEVKGPHIYTAGAGLFPPHAIPFYLKDLPPAILKSLPQPDTPEEAATIVHAEFALGTDIVKLFTGSYVAPGRVVPMPLAIAKAAVDVAHERGRLVFAHPSNLDGVVVAMRSGVDVLAHAPDTVDGVDDTLIGQLVAHHMAMAPTLKLFSIDNDIVRIRAIVLKFHELGGPLLFGTDTGYLTDYDVAEEYKQLGQAGLTFRDALAMLTAAPAKRFQVDNLQGRIAPGMNGDLTVLSADPASGDLTAFTHVKYTIRNGRVLWP